MCTLNHLEVEFMIHKRTLPRSTGADPINCQDSNSTQNIRNDQVAPGRGRGTAQASTPHTVRRQASGKPYWVGGWPRQAGRYGECAEET